MNFKFKSLFMAAAICVSFVLPSVAQDASVSDWEPPTSYLNAETGEDFFIDDTWGGY